MSASWYLFILLFLANKDSETTSMIGLFWLISLFITFH